jgi:hypothetical protein
MPPPAIQIVSAWMMIAPAVAAQRNVGFHHQRAAKFAAPDDQRFVQQAALF